VIDFYVVDKQTDLGMSLVVELSFEAEMDA
jgi:hypothetical protein